MNLNRTLDKINAKYGRETARAFAAAIDDVRSNVVLKRVIDALERGDIDAAIRALNIDETLFAQVRAAMTAAYNDGAVAVIAATRFNPPTATRAVVRWDASNPVAEAFIRNTVGEEITKITQSTMSGVREALANGYGKGQGPRNIALDVVGRVSPNGKRTGGLVGLSEPQVRYVQSMRDKLESGDYAGVKRMAKRDRRFDGALDKAIRTGKPLTKAQVDKISMRYSDRLLKLRGDTIARTETAGAVEQSRIDAFRVGMAKNSYPPQYVIKKWLHGGGGMKPRIQHMHESGQTVMGLDTPFVMQDSTLMQRPHDPAAPAKHVINCFPPTSSISAIGIKGGIRREYVGDLIKVSCGGMVDITVTPNHPILTQRGWVAAELVNGGDYIFRTGVEVEGVSKMNVDYTVSSAEELYNSMQSLGSVGGSIGTIVNLHGDIPDKDVDIVAQDSSLLSGVMPSCSEVFGEFILESTDVITSGLFVPAKLGLSYLIASYHADGGVCGFGSPLSILWGSLCSGPICSLTDVGLLYSKIIEACIDYRTTNPKLLGDSVSRKSIIEHLANSIVVDLSLCETLSKHPDGTYGNSVFSPEVVTHVSRSHYEGFVYNFQSENGILVSDSVVNHNCTCTLLLDIDWRRMRLDGVSVS